MIQHEDLRSHANRIRHSAVLGRSELMHRLFDYLVDCSLAGKAPKEIEIAIEVFGRSGGFEAAQDAMVRVYIHKLRGKLKEYYAGPGRHETQRITIPRGEYRLVFESARDSAETVAAPVEAQVEATPSSSHWLSHWKIAVGLIALLAVNLAGWFWFGGYSSANDLRAVRAHPIWQPLIEDERPVYIAVGDYYIFGELDADGAAEPESVRRLVREFNINSRQDLERWLDDRPELEDRYMDLALRYLPVCSAFALHNIAPLLQSNGKHPGKVQVILASELKPAMLRSAHVVYIGLISGMGILRDIAFAGSQFKIGDTYDELIDRKSNRVYVSQSSISINDNTRYRDYGYFSTFFGPNGNRIIVLAGTRDVAMMHTAEMVSRIDSLTQLSASAKTTDNFEALYAVDAIDHMNLDGKLIRTEHLDTDHMWSQGPTLAAAQIATSAW